MDWKVKWSGWLVNLDDSVDLSHKPEAGRESYGTCEQEEEGHHDGAVAEVEDCGHKARDVQLRDEVVDAVQEKVERSAAAHQVAAPSPVVVLCTEVEVAEEDSGLWAGDAQYHEHQELEAKHEVRLRWPYGVEDEEELDEDTAEGEHTTHHAAREGLRVDALVKSSMARSLPVENLLSQNVGSIINYLQ